MANAATEATFSGPPIVCYGAGMTVGSDRWAACLAMAELLRTGLTDLPAPVVGAADSGDLALIAGALATYSRWWRADRAAQPNLLPCSADARGDALAAVTVCGPVLVLPAAPSGESADTAAALAWARTMGRCTHLHPLGIGLSAASSAYPQLSPPVYRFSTTSWRDGLSALAALWRRPPPPTNAQHAAKAALVASDPARHRCLHPSLLASTLITD